MSGNNSDDEHDVENNENDDNDNENNNNGDNEHEHDNDDTERDHDDDSNSHSHQIREEQELDEHENDENQQEHEHEQDHEHEHENEHEHEDDNDNDNDNDNEHDDENERDHDEEEEQKNQGDQDVNNETNENQTDPPKLTQEEIAARFANMENLAQKAVEATGAMESALASVPKSLDAESSYYLTSSSSQAQAQAQAFQNNNNEQDQTQDQAGAGAGAQYQDENMNVNVNVNDNNVDDDYDDEDEGKDTVHDHDGNNKNGTKDEEEEQEQDDDEDEIRTMEDVRRARDERDHLIEINKARSKLVAAILEKEKSIKGHQVDDKSMSSLEQIRSEYMKNLQALNQLWDQLDKKKMDAEDRTDRLTAILDQQDENCTQLSDVFKAFKREIAREARFSRTGKPMALKRILAFESLEESIDRQVGDVRLKYITFQNELAHLEHAVRAKEELDEGLHLIDFEQLKIENQTLNEKIEERNDELHKLKKKTTSTVQVLTHIKEKLRFVSSENSELVVELASLHSVVSGLRDRLTRAKHVRDVTRAENLRLRQKQGFIGSDLLVDDFEHRKSEIKFVQQKVEELKMKYAFYEDIVKKANSIERNRLRRQSDRQGHGQHSHKLNNTGTMQGYRKK